MACRRKRLRRAAERFCAADRDAAGFDGEPGKVSEPEVLVDRERAPGTRRERLGREAFVIVGVERRREDRDRDDDEYHQSRDGGEQNLHDAHWRLLQQIGEQSSDSEER